MISFSQVLHNRTKLAVAILAAVTVSTAVVIFASDRDVHTAGSCPAGGPHYQNQTSHDSTSARVNQFGRSGSHLVTTSFFGHRVRVNSRVAPCLKAVERDLRRQNTSYRVKKVISYRRINGSDSRPWQYHAYGGAIDINPGDNPQCPGFDPKHRCKFRQPFQIPRSWIVTFNRYGFWWGGDYAHSAKDYMHFEWHR